MIKAVDICKYYGDVEVSKGVSFSIEKGEVVGLLGPNGAGKTTTMRILTSYLRPSSGYATIGEFDVAKQSMEMRRCLGYLPETPPLYLEMRVKDYLSFCGRLRGLGARQLGARKDDVIQKCLLEDVVNKTCGALSRGYRQRVGLAQALIHNPPVVILDEPTAGLDPAQIVDIRRLIKGLGGAHTVLLSTHMLREVEEVCGSVVVVSGGRVISQKKLTEIETSGQSLEQYFLSAIVS